MPWRGAISAVWMSAVGSSCCAQRLDFARFRSFRKASALVVSEIFKSLEDEGSRATRKPNCGVLMPRWQGERTRGGSGQKRWHTS
jgi:hypothetical protein